jgi:hypothetical protein
MHKRHLFTKGHDKSDIMFVSKNIVQSSMRANEALARASNNVLMREKPLPALGS